MRRGDSPTAGRSKKKKVGRSKETHRRPTLLLYPPFRSRAEDDGRDAFKALRSHRAGATCAYVYGEWAALEAATSGSASRAGAILAKGRAAGAEPVAVLDAADRLVSGVELPADLEASVPRWNDAPLAAGGDETATVRLPTAATRHTAAGASATAGMGRVSTTATTGPTAVTSTTAAISAAPVAATPGGSAARWGGAAAAATAPTPTATLRPPALGTVGCAAAPTPGTTRILPPSTFKVPRRIGAAGAGTPLPAAAGRVAAAATTPPPPATAAATTAAAAVKRKAAGEEGVSPAPAAAATLRTAVVVPVAGAAPKRRSPDPPGSSAGGAAAAPRLATTAARPPLAAVQGGAAAPPTAAAASSSPAPGRAAPPPPAPLPGGRSPAGGVRPAAGAPTTTAPTATTRRPREDEASIVVRGTRYAKLECVGRGGSSKVFKVMAPSRKIYALKRIRLAGRDAEAAAGFMDEIGLLTRLRGQPGIVQLVDAEVVPAEGLILMVLEYGDIDLARLLARQARQNRGGGGGGAAAGGGGEEPRPSSTTPPPAAAAAAAAAAEPDENFVRLYWQQMLRAVSAIHAARIVHSDLKPANFLVVQGTLKLIDFGIAKAISADTTSIARESQVGTLNYMSPEAILGGAPTGGRAGCKVGRPSDVWSLGCILYQMVHGRTPFAHLPFIQKMHAITDDRHAVAFPRVPGPAGSNAALGDVLRRTLDRNPRTRITIPELLAHPFLRPTAEREEGVGGGGASTAAPAPVLGHTRAQLQALLAKAAAAGAAGGLDVEGLLAETGLGGGGGLASAAAPHPPPQPAAAGARAASPKPPPAAPASTTTTSSAGGVAASLAALRFDDTAR